MERDKAEVKYFLIRLGVMMVVFWLLFGVVFGVTAMKDNSMSPKLEAGDLVLYYRLGKKLNDRSVIVFCKEGRQYVGRIVARGGDTVEVAGEDGLYINGYQVLETDIYYRTPVYDGKVDYPVTLKEDEVFVLCDYREGALDSRYFGPVKHSEIKGTVITAVRRSEISKIIVSSSIGANTSVKIQQSRYGNNAFGPNRYVRQRSP